MKLLFYNILILTLFACCGKKTIAVELKVVDKSLVHLKNKRTIVQLLTNQGIKYLNEQGTTIDSCRLQGVSCESALFSVTAFHLYYENNEHVVYLIKEIYDPFDDSDYHLHDTLRLSSELQNVGFVDIYKPGLVSIAQEHKPMSPPILSHLVAYKEDSILYCGIQIIDNKIKIVRQNSVQADSVAHHLKKHFGEPIIYVHHGNYGLLQYSDKAEFKSIQSFEFNYTRAQHSSGIWGYLKNDGTWFPDE